MGSFGPRTTSNGRSRSPRKLLRQRRPIRGTSRLVIRTMTVPRSCPELQGCHTASFLEEPEFGDVSLTWGRIRAATIGIATPSWLIFGPTPAWPGPAHPGWRGLLLGGHRNACSGRAAQTSRRGSRCTGMRRRRASHCDYKLGISPDRACLRRTAETYYADGGLPGSPGSQTAFRTWLPGAADHVRSVWGRRNRTLGINVTHYPSPDEQE